MSDKLNALHYAGKFEENFIPHILKELYMDKLYEPFLMGRKDLTVVDLGANIGLTCQYFAKYSKRLVAVEPEKDNFSALSLNTKGLPITYVKAAIVNSPKKVKLYHSDNRTAHNVVTPMKKEADFEEVQGITIEELFKNTNLKEVDFMKLDIEGAEFEVLGGKPFSRIAKRINLIIGEMHSWAGRNYGQVRWSLKDNGFDFRNIPADASIFVARRIHA